MEQTNDRPIVDCLNSLNTGVNKEFALAQARKAYAQWIRVDASDSNLSFEELKELLNLRSNVLGIVAAVYVWNKKFDEAYAFEDQFLFNTALWQEDNQQEIDLYLIHLIMLKQTEHLKKIFEDKGFKETFLQYEDLYLSTLNPKYEFQSDDAIFFDLLNRVTNYNKLIYGSKLF